MKPIDLITQAAQIIKNSGFENISINMGSENQKFNKAYEELCREIEMTFPNEIKELWQQHLGLKISWCCRKIPLHTLYGCIDMIPIEDIIPYHNEMIEVAKSAIEYADSGSQKARMTIAANAVKDMYPIFEFRTADMLCIKKSTGHIVLFCYDLLDLLADDTNGIVIAENISDLIEKWSKILFLEQFWCETEHNRCVNEHGIDLENDYLKNLHPHLQNLTSNF